MRLGLALLVLAVIGSPARAQLSTGAEITFDDFWIQRDGTFVVPPTELDQRFFLNLATCECSKADAADTSIGYNLGITVGDGPVTPAEIWVGTGCDLEATREMTCRRVGTVADIYTFDTGRDDIEVNVFDLVNNRPGDEEMTCKSLVSSTIWLLVDEGTNGSYELIESIGAGNTDTNMPANGGVDTTPPALPENILAQASEEAIRITWDVPLSDQGIFGYQALCARAGVAEPVFTDRVAAQYRTAARVCNGSVEVDLSESPVAETDAGEALTEPLSAFRRLDETFLCGEALSPTASTLTIQGLENDVPYEVALVVVDDHGNYTATYFTNTVIPKSVTDLWEDIHGRGGEIQGGCLGTSLPGDGGPMGGLVVGLGLLVATQRRRRRRILVAGALVTGLAGTATAEDFRPYWEEEQVVDDGTNLFDLDDVRWHVGIKVGPYIPDIDGQAGVNSVTKLGPYAAMFGTYYDSADTDLNRPFKRRVWQILPVLDVDYVLHRGFGQLTVGGSIGYMQKSARAYLAGTSPSDPKRPRSDSDETTFRLVPMQMMVGYRLTYIANTFGVPVVPYVRGGLAYYAWRMTAPSGEPSQVCEVQGQTPCREFNKAVGASLGFAATLGLAIRAENIDRDSARSMRETGIDHAGFYIEWSLAKVDGFGATDKLSVGDSTYFGGIDFEF